MNIIQLILLSAQLSTSQPAVQSLYTCEGTDPSFATVLESVGVIAGDRFSKGPVLGSRVRVNHELLEKQVGKTGTIPEDIGLHTEVCGDSIRRKDFDQWTRWYQEEGKVQVFRLFKGEQNVRGGEGEGGSPGRVETFSKAITVDPGTWHEFEATYTIIKPVGACIFQLMHAGTDDQGKPLLWPVHVDMSANGDIVVLRRRPAAGEEKRVVIAENMAGKSFSIRVRANGEDYEVYQKAPLDGGPWKLVSKGSYAKAKDNKISFRWGMYCGSKKGQAVPNDALLFVTGVAIR